MIDSPTLPQFLQICHYKSRGRVKDRAYEPNNKAAKESQIQSGSTTNLYKFKIDAMLTLFLGAYQFHTRTTFVSILTEFTSVNEFTRW